MCEHCYFEIKYHTNDDDGLSIVKLVGSPQSLFCEMVKTLKMECPRYHCNSPIQNGDLITHLNSCVNLISPSKDKLGGYLQDFPDPKELIKTFKFHEGLLYSMKVYTEEKDWDYSYFLEYFIHRY